MASTVWDGFFPYLVQLIISMGGCVGKSKVKVTGVIQIFAVLAGDILVDHGSTISSFIFACIL